MPGTNKNEQEFKTFGISGNLKTGFITGLYGLLFSAIVFLYQENRRLNEKVVNCGNEKVELQADLYNMMIPQIKREVKKEVTEQVSPIAENVDTATTNLKEFIGGIEK